MVQVHLLFWSKLMPKQTVRYLFAHKFVRLRYISMIFIVWTESEFSSNKEIEKKVIFYFTFSKFFKTDILLQ
jgi:hypothetical protein